MSSRARALVALAIAVPSLCVVSAVTSSSARVIAQEPPRPGDPPEERLSIRARGQALAAADSIEVELVVLGTGDTAEAAEKRHRDRLRRVLGALTGTAPKDPADETPDEEPAEDDERPRKKGKKGAASGDLPRPGVADEDGLVFDVRDGRYTVGLKGTDPDEADEEDMGENLVPKEAEIRVGSAVHVTFKNLAKSSPQKLRKLLARTFDRAAEGGAEMGTPKTRIRPAVRFRPKDLEALKREAYAQAIAKGRERAQALGKLAGRTVGKLVLVTDVDEGNGGEDDGYAYGSHRWRTGMEAFLSSLRSISSASDDAFSRSSEVRVEVLLQLEFELK